MGWVRPLSKVSNIGFKHYSEGHGDLVSTLVGVIRRLIGVTNLLTESP